MAKKTGVLKEEFRSCAHRELLRDIYLDENVLDYQTERYIKALESYEELYGEQENGDTAEFYEKFADWLDECTANGNLPELSGQLQSRSIRATTGGYLYDNQGTKCQYRIQCQFIYFKRR